ncbi:MAG: DUF2760 domain-containing protein [Bryobacteraceae bacterium]
MSRVSFAFRSFFSLLFSDTLPEDIANAYGFTKAKAAPIVTKTAPKPDTPKAVAGPAEGAVELLGALQRESRIVDFLMEDISGYSDDQVGAAVRDVHEGARKALDRHAKIVPVIDGVEGAFTKLDGIGKNSYKLLGNVPTEGKATGGTLRHRGWKVDKIELPSVKPGERMLAPAEIEIE